MSSPFKSIKVCSAFARPNEPTDAGTYILNKKITSSFCKPNICHPNKNVYSESNLLLLRKANSLFLNPNDSFDKTQLYTNLYTKMDLSYNFPIISDLSGNYPVTINPNTSIVNPNGIPFTNYQIDPSGHLFGQTICGINNYRDYLQYNTSCNYI
jgi:hypothetical protein